MKVVVPARGEVGQADTGTLTRVRMMDSPLESLTGGFTTETTKGAMAAAADLLADTQATGGELRVAASPRSDPPAQVVG